jgi:hypothetical protein
MCFCISTPNQSFANFSFNTLKKFNRLSYFEPMRAHSWIGFSFQMFNTMQICSMLFNTAQDCSSFVVHSLLLKSGLKGKRLNWVQSLSRRWALCEPLANMLASSSRFYRFQHFQVHNRAEQWLTGANSVALPMHALAVRVRSACGPSVAYFAFRRRGDHIDVCNQWLFAFYGSTLVRSFCHPFCPSRPLCPPIWSHISR